MPWDCLVASAIYSYAATSWRREASKPGGVSVAWFVGGLASIGSIALLLLIAIKIKWWFALLCIVASFVGQWIFMPLLDWTERTVVGLWAGAALLVVAAAYMVYRIV